MKTKIFLSSILTIALCLSLIVGSTFALFETKQEVNIAVTAGKVEISAVIPETTLVKDLYVGTATYDSTSNKLDIVNIVPGDTVKFNIEVSNSSNIPVQYKVKANSGVTSGVDLLDALTCTVKFNGDTYTMNASNDGFETAYITPAAGTTLTNIEVTIEFPANDSNINYDLYQGEGTSLTFVVEAVQGNNGVNNNG